MVKPTTHNESEDHEEDFYWCNPDVVQPTDEECKGIQFEELLECVKERLEEDQAYERWRETKEWLGDTQYDEILSEVFQVAMKKPEPFPTN